MSEGHPFRLRFFLSEYLDLDLDSYPMTSNYSIEGLEDAWTVEGALVDQKSKETRHTLMCV